MGRWDTWSVTGCLTHTVQPIYLAYKIAFKRLGCTISEIKARIDASFMQQSSFILLSWMQVWNVVTHCAVVDILTGMPKFFTNSHLFGKNCSCGFRHILCILLLPQWKSQQNIHIPIAHESVAQNLVSFEVFK